MLRQSLPAYTVCAVGHSPYRDVSAHLPNRHKAVCIVAMVTRFQRNFSFMDIRNTDHNWKQRLRDLVTHYEIDVVYMDLS